MPTCPVASDVVVTTRAGAMVRLSERVVVWTGLAESVTRTPIAVAFTAAVGVPLIVPLAASVRPVGSVPLASAQ